MSLRSRCSVFGVRFGPNTEHRTPPHFVRFRIIYLSVALLRRVFAPRAGLPHGLIGVLRPMGDLPSPPPCGWSRGFITTPRLAGRIPSQPERPAFPSELFSCSGFPTV